MYIARFSDNITEDIKRNWSSWSYGAEGFEGTEEELIEWIENNRGSEISISGFEEWVDEAEDGDDVMRRLNIRELYSNYWVCADLRFGEGLCGHELWAETLEEAIAEVEEEGGEVDGLGDGEFNDCSGAKVVWSGMKNGMNVHILDI